MRHIEALRGELDALGHHVRVLAPLDHDTRATALAHRGARPQEREQPDWLIPLGPTLGWPSNGAVSNLSGSARAVVRLRSELRAGGYDVVHVHEPVTPHDRAGTRWSPPGSRWSARSTATPRAARRTPSPTLLGARRRLNHLTERIAVSEAAAWTGKRFYGGEYRIVPNGVSLPAGGVPAPRLREPGEPLRIAFVGQAVERKGLPVLLRAFEALREHVPVELTIVGASEPEVAPLLVDRTRRRDPRPRLGRPTSTRSSPRPTSSPRRRSAASRSAWC